MSKKDLEELPAWVVEMLEENHKQAVERERNYQPYKSPVKKINTNKVNQRFKRIAIGAVAIFAVASVLFGCKINLNNQDSTPIRPNITTQSGIKDNRPSSNYSQFEYNISNKKYETRYSVDYLMNNYMDYLVLDTYHGSEMLWYYCPTDMIEEIAKSVINKTNEDCQKYGEDSGFVADWITPKLIVAMCLTESSRRVFDENMNPIVAETDELYKSKAKGMLQLKSGALADSCEYYGARTTDETFKNILSVNAENDPRFNPYTCVMLAVNYLNRLDKNFLQDGKTIPTLLGFENFTGEDLLELKQRIGTGMYFAGGTGFKNLLSDSIITLDNILNPSLDGLVSKTFEYRTMDYIIRTANNLEKYLGEEIEIEY